MLSQENHIQLIQNAPIVRADFIVLNNEDEILVGKRVNRPARGMYSVPGGRVRKNEQICDAVKRITQSEIGIEIDLDKLIFLGHYEHLYQENAYGRPAINTHYFTCAYLVRLDNSVTLSKDQHSDSRWVPLYEMQSDLSVHTNSRDYAKDLVKRPIIIPKCISF